MKKKIFSLLLIFTMFFGFAIINVEAQAEFVDDNTFVVSNADYTMNEEDIKELFLFLLDYVNTYDLLILDDDGAYAVLNDNLYDVFDIDFQADLSNLQYRLEFNMWSLNHFAVILRNYTEDVVFNVSWNRDSNEVEINSIETTYDFELSITLFEEETIEEEGLSIFGFFNNFYSNYIFPDNLLDTQTLNLITAVTTLMFFIGVFRGIYSIFFRNKRK